MLKKILIVDDETLARDRIKRFLKEIGQEFVIKEANSGIAAKPMISEFEPDILFLDIQMPGLTGIELLAQLETRSFHVIFQTAFDQYALDAFKENACDYLLKPFDRLRFEEALNRALEAQSLSQRLEELEEKFRQRDGYLQKISIKHRGIIQIIQVDQIICFVSKDHYTCVITDDFEYICDLSLGHLEKYLNPNIFLRTHRNSIIATSHLKNIVPGENMQITLSNNQVLPVSRSKRSAVKALTHN